MKRMHLNLPEGGTGVPRCAQCDPLVQWLEELRPGRRLRATDGTPFIRTDRTCICFCNLKDGSLCSAKDICRRNGGVALDELKAAEES